MDSRQPHLPHHMHDAMKLYVQSGIEPGSFLTAVLCNDLKESVVRADSINILYLTNIVSYCYNFLPQGSWGSHDNYAEWVSGGGLEGMLNQNNQELKL